jgi:hypothetical protein
LASPTVSANNTLKASASLGAGATASNNLDITVGFEARIQVTSTGGGTVAATNGLRVNAYRYADGGTSNPDTIAFFTMEIPTTVSTAKRKSFALPTGSYKVEWVNLDASNAITVAAIYESTPAII